MPSLDNHMRKAPTAAFHRLKRISRTAYPNRAGADPCRPAGYRTSGGTSARK